MSIDLALDKDTHDLLIQKNDLKVVDGTDQLEQRLKIKLLFFKGEWFLDTVEGLPFYEEILVKNPNFPNIDNLIKAAILEDPEVEEILEYRSNYDKTKRSYSITFKARSSHGEISVNSSIT